MKRHRTDAQVHLEIGEVWEELGSIGWLIVSEPWTDPKDELHQRVITMVALYSYDDLSSEAGLVEDVPTRRLRVGWTRAVSVSL